MWYLHHLVWWVDWLLYQNRIKHLEEAHRVLDKQIDSMERTGIYDDLKIDELKKQRLRLKDDIVILKHKHEAVMQEAQAQQEAKRNGLELWNVTHAGKRSWSTAIGRRADVRIELRS